MNEFFDRTLYYFKFPTLRVYLFASWASTGGHSLEITTRNAVLETSSDASALVSVAFHLHLLGIYRIVWHCQFAKSISTYRVHHRALRLGTEDETRLVPLSKGVSLVDFSESRWE